MNFELRVQGKKTLFNSLLPLYITTNFYSLLFGNMSVYYIEKAVGKQ